VSQALPPGLWRKFASCRRGRSRPRTRWDRPHSIHKATLRSAGPKRVAACTAIASHALVMNPIRVPRSSRKSSRELPLRPKQQSEVRSSQVSGTADRHRCLNVKDPLVPSPNLGEAAWAFGPPPTSLDGRFIYRRFPQTLLPFFHGSEIIRDSLSDDPRFCRRAPRARA